MLADDYFRLAHSDTTGRPLLHPRALGTGLAGALLGELVLGGHVAVEAGAVRLLEYGQRARPPQNALAHAVLDQLRAEQLAGPGDPFRPADIRSASNWLNYLGLDAVSRVGDRMTRANHVVPLTPRRPWRRDVTYVPTDWSVAARPRVRLRMLLTRGGQWTWADVTLLGLAQASGLAGNLLLDLDAPVRRRFAEIVAGIHAPVRELVDQTEAAIAAAVLSHRV